jgi:hypothetical protein
VAAGTIREVDPDAVATVLWASWNGIISLGWRPDDLHRSDRELRALLRTATDVIALGLLTDRGKEAGTGQPETGANYLADGGAINTV